MNSTKLDDPFFLVYDSRSGSTFLANLLVKFVGAAIPPETNFITAILREYPKKAIDSKSDLNIVLNIVYKDRKFSDWNLERAELEKYVKPEFPLTVKDLILQICDLYKIKNFPNAKIFGLKKGVYLTKHSKMKEMFPQAKFVGIIRDGRAVFNSKKQSIYSVTGKPFETNPYKAAKEWCRICKLLKEACKIYPTETIVIHYEKMIQNPENVVANLQKFFNIRDVEKTEETKYVIAGRYGDIHKNVNKKPLSERIIAWQKSLTKEEIYAYESVAYKQLLLAGYTTISNNILLKNKFINKVWKFFLKIVVKNKKLD